MANSQSMLAGVPRSLPVVPLIADQRYYGEAPVRPARGRAGVSQGIAGALIVVIGSILTEVWAQPIAARHLELCEFGPLVPIGPRCPNPYPGLRGGHGRAGRGT